MHTRSSERFKTMLAATDQVAQAAENLRLVNETWERSSCEQAIREVTDKLRAAPNPDTLLEIEAREIGQRPGVRHAVSELGTKTELLGNGQYEPRATEKYGNDSGQAKE